jgi:hypothetical protein
LNPLERFDDAGLSGTVLPIYECDGFEIDFLKLLKAPEVGQSNGFESVDVAFHGLSGRKMISVIFREW